MPLSERRIACDELRPSVDDITVVGIYEHRRRSKVCCDHWNAHCHAVECGKIPAVTPFARHVAIDTAVEAHQLLSCEGCGYYVHVRPMAARACRHRHHRPLQCGTNRVEPGLGNLQDERNVVR